MKNKLKSLISSVLVFAIVFSAFGIIASADTSATFTAVESDTGKTNASGDHIYKMTFTLTADTDVRTLGIAFSYDNTAIQPTGRTSSSGYADITMAANQKGCFKAYSFTNEDDETVQYTINGVKFAENGDRTALNPSLSTQQTINAASGIKILEFWYRIKDASKMNKETFKFETDYTEGSFLKGFYGDESEAAAIVFNSTYKYGAYVGEDAIAASWTYTNSDKEPATAKTQIDVSGVTVDDVTKTYDGKAATVAAANLPEGVTANVTYSSTDAPVNAGAYTATVTLTATDAENTELVNIPEDLTATITINTVKVAIDVITIEGETTVQIPAELELTLANVPETVTATIEYKVGEEWVTTVPTEAGTYDVRVNVVAKDAKNYELTGEAATTTATILEADPVKEDLAVVTGVKELVINGKTYKDLYKVDVAISEGFVGKKITKYGVIFKDATEGATKGGAKIEVTPDTVIQIAEGGKFEFSAAVIGIPDTVTAVTATPFVWSK